MCRGGAATALRRGRPAFVRCVMDCSGSKCLNGRCLSQPATCLWLCVCCGPDEVVELAPLRALTSLLELRMVNGTHEMSGVPVSVSALQALTLLSFQGEQRLRKLGAVTGVLSSECKPRRLLAIRLMPLL